MLIFTIKIGFNNKEKNNIFYILIYQNIIFLICLLINLYIFKIYILLFIFKIITKNSNKY